FRLTLYPSPNAAPDSGSNRFLLQFDPRAAESLAVIFGPRMTGDLLSAIDPAVLRAARSRSGSYWLAGRQAQARQNELAVFGAAPWQVARHDQRGDRAQPGGGRACLFEPPHMGVARSQRAVRARIARIVLNGQEQLRRRIVKLMFEEIGRAHRG